MQSGDDAAESLTSGAECAANVAMDAVIRTGISHLNANGKQFFGRGFSFVSSMRYSPFDGSHLQGDIDMVVPLRFGGGDQAAANLRSAWFMQNGLTRWTDSHGLRRNDVRFGFVHRFTAGLDQHGTPNLLGAYALLQQNRERGHQRMVVGMDYAGRWGKGFINHYAPQSGWQAGRVGYQERAVGGAEIGVSLTPTTALDMSLAAGE